MLSFPNPQRAVSDVSSSRCLPEGSSDARPYHPKCFRVLRENPFSSVGNGLLPEQPIKFMYRQAYITCSFLCFLVREKCMTKHHPYHRSNRSDKEKAERLQIDPIKDQAFSHAIARIDGKHEHKAKSNRRQPFVLSPIIVFPIKRDRTIVAAGSIIHWAPPACASVILPAENAMTP